MNATALPKSPEELKSLKTVATAIYALQAAFAVLIPFLIAPLLILWKRKQAKGTWLESHLRWQSNTFWFSMAGFIIGIPCLKLAPQVGVVVLSATLMWIVFRIGQGWTRLGRGQAMFAGEENHTAA